jgi:integrase
MVHVMKKTEDVPDNRYMIRRRQGWYVRLAVPPRLVKKLGKQHILKSLKTRDVAEARQKRWEAIAAIKRQLRELEGGSAWDPVKVGLQLRERYLDADPEPPDPERDESNDNLSEREDVRYEIKMEVDEFRDAGLSKEAALLYKIATSEHIAVLLVAEEQWLGEIADRQNAQSIRMHRGVLKELHEAFPEAKLAEDIDRRKAGRFVSEVLRKKGLSQGTINRKLWSLSSFWEWMAKRGLIEHGTNPWKGQGDYSEKQAKKARKAGTDIKKRPFTKDELVALLKADPKEHSGGSHSGELHDLIRLGLVTGCRLDELCELQVGDVLVQDRAIRIREGKTENAARTIPVLEDAWGIIERRLQEAPKGKPEAYLLPDLKPGGPDRKRSWYLTKVFTRFRRSVLGEEGEVDLASGRSKSPVDFHSFRRTFAGRG